MRRFKIDFDRIEARRNAENQQEENKRKAEDQKARDYAKKYPDRYKDIVSFDLPLVTAAKNGMEFKLVLSAIRNGNDDEDDDVNEIMLNIRTFIKTPDEDFKPTKKGIFVPMLYANQIASTIFEILEELKKKNIKDINGEDFIF